LDPLKIKHMGLKSRELAVARFSEKQILGEILAFYK
jgi:hypothetical protein